MNERKLTRSDTAFGRVALHAVMVADRARTAAFTRALHESVRPGDVVVDIGTGCGLLAVVAARAGARRVYAIERSAIAELAETVIRQNGVDETVTVVRADSRDVTLPEPADVIVSETIGSIGFNEGIVPLMNAAADQCKPEARFIPNSVRLGMAPVADPALAERLECIARVSNVDLREVQARAANQPVGRRTRSSELLGPLVWSAPVVLPGGTVPETFTTVLSVERDGSLSAIGVFFAAELGGGITISNAPGTDTRSWFNVQVPIWPPLLVIAGDRIELKLVLSELGLARWTARRGDDVRSGDEMLTTGGHTLEDFASQLGLVPKTEPVPHVLRPKIRT
jgi:precorrin-6B methylase 2